ncbi:MAG: GTP-binding protein [Candidatus Jordarchaeaceae archaeon]
MPHFKVVVAGPRASGKTEIVSKLAEMSGKEPIRTECEGVTVGMDYTYCDVNDSRVHFFGTPGSEHFSVVRKSLSKGMNALLLVVDNSNPESFQKAREIYKELVEEKKVPTLVVVNKKNSEENSLPEEIKSIAKELNTQIVTINAKSGEGIEKLLLETVKVVQDHQK